MCSIYLKWCCFNIQLILIILEFCISASAYSLKFLIPHNQYLGPLEPFTDTGIQTRSLGHSSACWGNGVAPAEWRSQSVCDSVSPTPYHSPTAPSGHKAVCLGCFQQRNQQQRAQKYKMTLHCEKGAHPLREKHNKRKCYLLPLSWEWTGLENETFTTVSVSTDEWKNQSRWLGLGVRIDFSEQWRWRDLDSRARLCILYIYGALPSLLSAEASSAFL